MLFTLFTGSQFPSPFRMECLFIPKIHPHQTYFRRLWKLVLWWSHRACKFIQFGLFRVPVASVLSVSCWFFESAVINPSKPSFPMCFFRMFYKWTIHEILPASMDGICFHSRLHNNLIPESKLFDVSVQLWRNHSNSLTTLCYISALVINYTLLRLRFLALCAGCNRNWNKFQFQISKM